jgi:hypothetical protein
MLAAGLLLLGGEASNAALLRTFSPTTPALLVLREAETPAAALISTPQLECDLNTTQQAATALFRLSSELAQPQKNGAGHKSQPCMDQEPVPTTSNSQQRQTLRSGCRSGGRRGGKLVSRKNKTRNRKRKTVDCDRAAKGNDLRKLGAAYGKALTIAFGAAAHTHYTHYIAHHLYEQVRKVH